MKSLLPLPERLGKYEIAEVLGTGAMGVIYKGFDPNIRRAVAIKTIRRELIEEDRAHAHTALARFKNEAQAAGRLSHPGIVAVYDYGEDAELAYIAMEYVEGNSLREYFSRDTRFSAGDTVSLMAQLLDALAYAHEQGVWHRDIKPANLLVMLNGKLKIADFGIARIDSSSLTQIGAVMGTPGYMAPEQYAGSDVDWRADLFSAGVVLYQLLTGVRPFVGSADSIAYKVCHQDAPAPSHTGAHPPVPAAYDAVVARAMAKNPAERFQTAQEFRAALLEAYAAPVSPALSEETLITGILPTTAAGRTTAAPSGWDLALLKAIEAHFARFMGPVAKVLVRRTGRQTTDLDELYARLAEMLASTEERKAFLATRRPLTGAPRREAPAASGAALTPEVIDAAQRRLAASIGPIAKVMVRKAAASAGSSRQFHLLLADSLGSEAERTRFLRDVGVL